MSDNFSKTFDKELELVPVGTGLTTETGTTPLFIGSGFVDADLVIDLDTVSGTTNAVALQFCVDKEFSGSEVSGPSIAFKEAQTGRAILPFRNDPGGVPLPYIRIMPTVETTLKLGAFIAKR